MGRRLKSPNRKTRLVLIQIFLALLIFQPVVFRLNAGAYNGQKSSSPKYSIPSKNGEPISHEGLTTSIPPKTVIGEQTVIFIFVQFSDVKNSTPIETIMEKIYWPLCDYYKEVSYSKISIKGQYNSVWINLPNKMAYYGADSADEIDVNGYLLFYDTVKSADSYIDFSPYKHLTIVHAGDDQADSAEKNDIWSMYYSGLTIPTNDGITVTNGLTVAETSPMGTFAHELGHSLGLPDLYDYNYQQEFVGFWSLMGYGGSLGSPLGSCPSHIMSPERIWLGWLASNQIVSITNGIIRNITLNNLEISGGTLAVKVPLGITSYYTIEYRRNVLFDKYLPMEGVIISYVDENLESGQGIVRVQDARPNSKNYPYDLTDAAFTSGMRFVDREREVAVKIWSLSETAFLQAQRGFADLKVEALTFTGDLIPGSPLVFQSKISNVGVTASNYAEVELKIDGLTVARKGLPLIPALSSVIIDVGNWTATGGSHKVEAFVDITDNVVEKNETNNSHWTTIEIMGKVIIDHALVSSKRVDVGSTQNVYFHAVWEGVGTPVKSGLIYVNGAEYVTNSTGWITMNILFSTVGKHVWTITGVYCYGITAYEKVVSDPSIIWDRVAVTLNVLDTRIDVGTSASISKSGIYEYDGTVFTGAINLNDTETKSVVGKYYYRTLNISDPTYGLTVFTTNVVYCIFDRIQVTITTPQERVGVETKAPLTWAGKYEYDGAKFTGEVTLSEELMKSSIGRFNYTVKNISDPLYGLKTFVSNTVDVIFDRIVIDLQTETLIPGSIKPIVRLRYQFDGAPVVDAKVVIDGTEATNLGNGSYITHTSTWSPYVTYNIQIDKSGFITMRTSGSVFALGNIAVISSITIILVVVIVAAIKRRQGSIRTA